MNVNALGVFMRDAPAMQVDAKQRERTDERARRAEVVSGLPAAPHVYIPCGIS